MVCEEGKRAEGLEKLRGCWEAVVNEAENAVGLKRHGLAFRLEKGLLNIWDHILRGNDFF